MRPKLSICIPTYNRFEILKDSILNNLDFFEKNNIEVCISNNASSDNTKDFLESLISKFGCVKVIHQNKNNGLEQNMIDAMKMANGEFLLPIGDDEVIDILYLPEVLKKLNLNPEVLILNGLHGIKEHLGNDLKDLTFNDPYIAFPLLWNKMPPGSFIVKSELLINKNYKKYMGTSHAYTGWVWEYLYSSYEEHKKVRICTTSEPVIIYKNVEKTWKNDVIKIMYHEIPLWFTLLSEHYKVIEKQNILKKYLKQKSKVNQLLSYRARTSDFTNEVLEYMGSFNRNQQTKAKIIGYIPQNIAKKIIHFLVTTKNIVKWIIRW